MHRSHMGGIVNFSTVVKGLKPHTMYFYRFVYSGWQIMNVSDTILVNGAGNIRSLTTLDISDFVNAT